MRDAGRFGLTPPREVRMEKEVERNRAPMPVPGKDVSPQCNLKACVQRAVFKVIPGRLSARAASAPDGA